MSMEQKSLNEALGEALSKPLTLKGHTDTVYSVTLTPDGKHAVSGSLDNTLRLWDLTTGVCVREFKGHTDPVCSVTLTPDGKHAVSGS